MKRIFVSLLFLLAVFSQARAAEPVLLVGNSFTGYTYAQISFRTLFKERWIGGYNLDDHYRDSFTLSSICNVRTFVLLQDFSTRAAQPDLFQIDMDEMVPYVRNCNAVPVLFMTWETREIAFATVRAAYEQAAARHNTQIVPVGLVFNRVRAQSESMYQSFIQTDGKHPTVRGSKVAAASILRAFCTACFQSFDWSGFSQTEITLIRGIINENIVTIVLPPPESRGPEGSEMPVGTQGIASLPAIISLLLSN